MKLPPDDWKGFLPNQYYMEAKVDSRYFHSSLRSAIKAINNKCGGVPKAKETADFLEKLAKELRESPYGVLE